MNDRNKLIAASLAVVAALGVGYGVARITGPTETEAAAPAGQAEKGEEGEDGEEGEEAGPEGEVHLTAAQATAAGITIVSPQRGGGAETQLSGRVEPTPEAQAAVGATIGGRIERLLVSAGSTVRAGQAVAIVVSGEAAALNAEAEAAQSEAETAQLAYTRDARLQEQGVVARQEVEASRSRLTSAQARSRAAAARAQAAGNPNGAGRATVTAPIGGVITRMNVAIGDVVGEGGSIATLANPSQRELVFNAPAGLSTVRPGTALAVRGVDGSEYRATVTAVAPDATGTSGMTLIRAKGVGALPPVGSPVSASLLTGADGLLTVPSSAVQTLEGRSVVFVATDDGFKAAPVLIGRQAAGRTEILNGLVGNERIAGTGAFRLKAELAKGEAEEEE